MKLRLTICFIYLVFVSCAVDYDMDKSSINEPERIIINSILNPLKPIQIRLHKVQKASNVYTVIGLMGAYIRLKENDSVLFDDIYPDSVFSISQLPLTGATYSIEVSFKGLGTAKAQTKIPKAIHCKSDFRHDEHQYWDESKYLLRLKSFEIQKDKQSCIWITSYQLYENNEVIQYNELYTNNIFVDKSNSVSGMDIKNEEVGSIYHNGFLRIKNKNISHLNEIIFTPNYVFNVGDSILDSSRSKIQLKLITASSAYDQYNKSLYEQKSMIIYDNDISSIFYQPNSVYCNIENGLGIFAGMNEVSYLFQMPAAND